jgi:hypothetical protein
MIAHQYQRRRLLEKFTKDHTNDDDDGRQVLVIAHMALRQGDIKEATCLEIFKFCKKKTRSTRVSSKTSTFVLSGMTGGLKSTKHQQANTEATKQRADPKITSPETCRYRDYTTRDIYTSNKNEKNYRSLIHCRQRDPVDNVSSTSRML